MDESVTPMKRLIKTAIAAATASFVAAPAAAELELSFYMGLQSVQDSTISGTLPGSQIPPQSVNWEGKPLENPFYYGARGTWWTANNLGFGLELTHAKAYADAASMAAIGVSRLELSDGHNIITANVMKRWPGAFAKTPKFTPYVGAGLGIAMPHVDVQPLAAGSVRTFGYETTGPAARGIAGLKYDLNQDWALFGEYQVTWSDNDLTVDGPGGTSGELSTEIVTHAVNFGVSYSF
jgi:lipid A oxidase